MAEVRKKLDHEEPGSVEMSDVEANEICQWFEQNGDRLETANGKNRKIEKFALTMRPLA